LLRLSYKNIFENIIATRQEENTDTSMQRRDGILAMDHKEQSLQLTAI
jgi:hypothetical protein